MIMRSRCQGECEADVEMNAKPISRHSEIDVKTCASNLVLEQITGTHSSSSMSEQMRSRCQDEREADVKIMRCQCQGKCEADVEANAKSMSR